MAAVPHEGDTGILVPSACEVTVATCGPRALGPGKERAGGARRAGKRSFEE